MSADRGNDIPTNRRAAICGALLALMMFCAFGLYGWTEGWHDGQMECMRGEPWAR